MKNTVFAPCLALLLLLTGTAIHAQERQNIIDHGTDGDVRYYTVVCPSGKRTSIDNHYEEGKVCTMLVNGKKRVCQQGWSIDEAAKTACQ